MRLFRRDKMPEPGHWEGLRERLSALAATAPPSPWRRATRSAVGGLVCVGTVSQANGREYVIAVSTAGRGVFDGITGERLARDRADLNQGWFEESALHVDGIGPLAGQQIPVAGLWGGGLRLMTSDLWTVAVHAPSWPQKMVVLQSPGREVLAEDKAEGCVVIDRPGSELVAVGFSESGRVLVEATASDLHIYARD